MTIVQLPIVWTNIISSASRAWKLPRRSVRWFTRRLQQKHHTGVCRTSWRLLHCRLPVTKAAMKVQLSDDSGLSWDGSDSVDSAKPSYNYVKRPPRVVPSCDIDRRHVILIVLECDINLWKTPFIWLCLYLQSRCRTISRRRMEFCEKVDSFGIIYVIFFIVLLRFYVDT